MRENGEANAMAKANSTCRGPSPIERMSYASHYSHRSWRLARCLFLLIQMTPTTGHSLFTRRILFFFTRSRPNTDCETTKPKMSVHYRYRYLSHIWTVTLPRASAAKYGKSTQFRRFCS